MIAHMDYETPVTIPQAYIHIVIVYTLLEISQTIFREKRVGTSLTSLALVTGISRDQ